MSRRVGLLFASAALFAMVALPVRADDVSDAGKKLVDKWQKSIVVVQVTAKSTMSYDGESPAARENKQEATAVLIDPSGLAVMSLSDTSPQAMMELMMPESSDGPKLSSEITEMKVQMPGGKQVRYKVVLRDKDLDIAFIRPMTPLAQPVTALDLSKSAKPQVLDWMVQLDRLPSVASYSLAAFPVRVNAIVQKPRTFYVSSAQGLGAPVFSLDGSVVGIVVLRGGRNGGEGGPADMMRIVLPAEDILDEANQAMKAAQ